MEMFYHFRRSQKKRNTPVATLVATVSWLAATAANADYSAGGCALRTP